MKKYYTATLFLLLALIVTSCDDKVLEPDPIVDPVDTLPDPMANSYLPMEVGATWIYEVSYEDSEGNPVTGDPDYQRAWDTVTVIEKAQFEGREAYRLETRSSEEGSSVLLQWWSVNGDELFVYREAEELEGNQNIPIPIPDLDIESKWMKALSSTDEKSIIDEIELERMEFPFFPGEIAGDIEITQKSTTHSDYSFGGEVASARKSVLSTVFEGKVYPDQLGGFGVDVEIAGFEEGVYMKGVGKVEGKTYTETDELVQNFFGETYTRKTVLIERK